MLRFTIRDVLWLMAMVAMLSLWAMERQTVNFDWSHIHQNEGRLYRRIEAQTEVIRRLSTDLASEKKLRVESESRLADLEASGP